MNGARRAVGRVLGGGGASPANVWRSGERAAARHLRRAGYKIIAKNQRVRAGEADLVCLAPDRRTLVIVEVKTRRLGPGAEPARGRPEDAITAHKRRKLVQVALSVAKSRGWDDEPVAIDVVAVDWRSRRDHEVRHYPRAVTMDR